MTRLVALVFTLCLSSVTAIMFRSGPLVGRADGRAINQSCLALADQGSCQFYACFEARLPCGRQWYILKSGQYYCNKLQRERASFSTAGQQFIDDAQTCLTRSLKDWYERDNIDCHELEHHAVSTISPCYTENGFCDVFQSDASNFFDVYEFSDLFSRGAAKIWRAIFSLATRCGGEAMRELSNNTGGTITNLFGSLTERFGK